MSIDVKTEQKNFWNIFDDKLIENGEPFFVLHERKGEVTYYAVVNKNRSFVDNALSIDFLTREQKLRINIYIRNDLGLYSVFERNRQNIEKMVGVPLQWIEGKKSATTRRIACEIPIEIGYCSNYADVIDEVLPVVVRMKKVCETFAKNHFFDF